MSNRKCVCACKNSSFNEKPKCTYITISKQELQSYNNNNNNNINRKEVHSLVVVRE